MNVLYFISCPHSATNYIRIVVIRRNELIRFPLAPLAFLVACFRLSCCSCFTLGLQLQHDSSIRSPSSLSLYSTPSNPSLATFSFTSPHDDRTKKGSKNDRKYCDNIRLIRWQPNVQMKHRTHFIDHKHCIMTQTRKHQPIYLPTETTYCPLTWSA